VGIFCAALLRGLAEISEEDLPRCSIAVVMNILRKCPARIVRQLQTRTRRYESLLRLRNIEHFLRLARGKTTICGDGQGSRFALRSFDVPKQAAIIRAALTPTGFRGTIQVTENTRAFSMTYWPLVVTTNYDDLYVRATADSPAFDRKIQVRARSRSDCHQVLKSLDDDLPPILWAVQGFVGGLAIHDSGDGVSETRLHGLIKQVVIGHQQYVQATNGEPHFRRAFAEMFRRRSLLFVGSGLQEDYIVSLFSEIVHHHGLGSFPHFALFDRNAKVDEWFLRTKLGINVLRYSDYLELPDRLKRIADVSSWSRHSLDGTLRAFERGCRSE
jgi:SIR2-like domain